MTIYTRFDALSDGRYLGRINGLATGTLAYGASEIIVEGDWRGHYFDLDTGTVTEKPLCVPEIKGGYSVDAGGELSFNVPASVNVVAERPDGSKFWAGQVEQDGVLQFASTLPGRYVLHLQFTPHPYRDQEIVVTVNAN